ncbi:MAG: hypothetical protein AAF191_17720 [Verrucomicrobiota bacterium]
MKLFLPSIPILGGMLVLGCGLVSCGSVEHPHLGPAGGRLLRATVIEMEPAVLESRNGEAGAFAGGAAGMILGGQIGGGHTEQAIGAVTGAVLGTVAGERAGRRLSRKKAWELTLQAENGDHYVTMVPEPHSFLLGGGAEIVVDGMGNLLEVRSGT